MFRGFKLMLFVPLLGVVAYGFFDNSNKNSCEQKSYRDFRSHAESCSKFYMCSLGTLISFNCPSGSVFHKETTSCVPEGSYYDTCTRDKGSLPICPHGATNKKAHPHECARFYDCNAPAQDMHWEEHERECEYPQLYNDIRNRCEDYKLVDCGTRKEPVDPCEYKANSCFGATSSCIPCEIRHPSCRGFQDGKNEWKGREKSPYFVECENQRIVKIDRCPVSLFDAETKMCKPMETPYEGFGQRGRNWY